MTQTWHIPTPTMAEQEFVFKAVKLGGLKAVGTMMSSASNISKNCLCAAAVAARILRHFDVAFKVVVGYTQLPGTAQSFTHVWLESPGGYVTDLTFSGPLRQVVILNWGVGFHDDAVRGVNTLEPMFPVDAAKNLPVEVLQEQARDLEGYVRRGKRHVHEAVDAACAKAVDGSDKLEITGVSSELLDSIRGGGTAEVPFGAV